MNRKNSIDVENPKKVKSAAEGSGHERLHKREADCILIPRARAAAAGNERASSINEENLDKD